MTANAVVHDMIHVAQYNDLPPKHEDYSHARTMAQEVTRRLNEAFMRGNEPSPEELRGLFVGIGAFCVNAARWAEEQVKTENKVEDDKEPA